MALVNWCGFILTPYLVQTTCQFSPPEQHWALTACQVLSMQRTYSKEEARAVVPSRVWLFANPTDCSPPGFSVHGLSRQEYCSGLPFPTPVDLPNLVIEPLSPTLAGRFLPTEPHQECPLPWSTPKISILEDPERQNYQLTMTYWGQLVSRIRPRKPDGARGLLGPRTE